MQTPLYSGSATPPVSSAPDIPSRRADDYRDPVDDVNDSYQRLQESLTVDDDTLLGKVKDTTAAPSEVMPIHSPLGQDGAPRYPDQVGESGLLDVGPETRKRVLQQQLGTMQPGPGLYEELKAAYCYEFSEDPICGPTSLGELAGFLHQLTPIPDIVDCSSGGAEGCGWLAMGVIIPGSNLLRGIDNAADVARATKAVNLPSWRKVDIDIDHVLDGHTRSGKRFRQSGKKDVFPSGMSATAIESTIRKAYRHARKAGPSQGDRVLLRGNANGLTIEMWVNLETKIIETAYPK